MGKEKPVADAIQRVLDNYEMIALFTNRCLLDPAVIYLSIGLQACQFYEKAQPFLCRYKAEYRWSELKQFCENQ